MELGPAQTESVKSRHVRRATLPDQGRFVGTEEQLGLVDVVRTTSQFNVAAGGCTTRRIRLHMVEFKEPRFCAPALRTDERTLAAISCPDLALHSGRDVARPRTC